MDYHTARKLLEAHGMQSRPGSTPGHFDALCIYTDAATGQTREEWETLPLHPTAIRNWLGY